MTQTKVTVIKDVFPETKIKHTYAYLPPADCVIMQSKGGIHMSDVPVYQEAEKALKIAKITMMMQKDTVCYTTVIFSLKQSFTEDVPTAATDGKRLKINPVFFTNLTPNQRITLLAHEALHVLLDHMHRKGNRDHQLWNIAGDYVINGSLVNAKYAFIDGCLHDRQYDGKMTEQVYDLLNKKSDKQKQDLIAKCNANGLNGNDVVYPDQVDQNDAVSQEEVTSVILRAVTQANLMGQSAGSMPSEIAVELQKTLNPPLPWYVILHNYLTNFAKDDFSFRRPNKRFMPQHYLPTAYSEAVCDIAIAVDISSSVTDAEFNVFIQKIAEIKSTMNPDKMTIISFNTRITGVQKLTADDNPLAKLKFKGRGGTNVADVLHWAAENKPTVLLVFTDGEFNQMQPVDKRVPIIWLIHNSPTWKGITGRTIHYNIK